MPNVCQAQASRAAPAAAIVFAFFASSALANVPPLTPVITEPVADGLVLNAEDVHMETGPFSDPDPGDLHQCTDWEIWTITPAERVWSVLCIGGVERLHVHLGDGTFEGSYLDRTSLLPSTNYRLRVRHSDDSGEAATRWSPYAQRLFSTGAGTTVFPLELDDVAGTPTPTLLDTTGATVALPNGAPPGAIRVESATGGLLLQLTGSGSGNQVTNPAALAAHAPVRVRIDAGSTGGNLILPDIDLAFTDDTGTDRTLYLPAVSLAIGTSSYFWVSANGSTYVGDAGQTQPNFTTLARGAAVPWEVLQPGYRVEIVATGFQLPLNIAFVPNPGPDPDDPLFYVTELYGNIRVIRRDGQVGTYASGLLNFNPTGDFPGSGEQGLTGIVVDPATGDVFVAYLYDAAPPDGPHYPRVARFTSTDGGLTASSQAILLSMVGESQGQSHQISNLSIGPDGKLYVHMGDGFDASMARNLSSYRGKILRMNLNGTAPTDNPFYNGAPINARDYVFALGFRNPFGGAWRGADGRHYEVENGPSVDRFAQVIAGRDYLWDGQDADMFNFALYNWDPAHAPVNIAFVQPQTFGGSQFPPQQQDHAFVSESGPTWGTGPQTNGKMITEFVLDVAGNLVSGPTTLIRYNGSGKATCAGLAAGPDGLYFTDLYKDLDYQTPIDPGANVLRIKFVGTADFIADVTSGPPPLTVQFTDLSNVPNPTSWSWSFGDGGTSTQRHPSHTYTADGVYDVRLSVTSPSGLVVEQKNAFIRVGDIYRVAVIGGSEPPTASDAAVANYLFGLGYDVESFDDDPANRPSAAQLAQQFQLAIVSSSAASGNIAGEFRTVNLPLIFWEQALLRTGRESLCNSGVVLPGATAVSIVNNTHALTEGLALGTLNVLNPGANMSLGQGSIATGATLLATRSGAAGDYAILAADAGAQMLDFVAPARRVFLFFEDTSFLSATPAGRDLLDRAVRWALDIQPDCPGDLDGSGQIDLADLAVLLANFGTPGGATEEQGDMDGNGTVDLADLSAFLARFGAACP